MPKRPGVRLGLLAGLLALAISAAGLVFATSATHAADERAQTLQIKTGESLFGVLLRAGATRTEADRAGRAIGRNVDIRRLQIGQRVHVSFDDNHLAVVSVPLDIERFAEARRKPGGGYTSRVTRLASVGVAAAPPAPGRKPDHPSDVLTITVRSGETIRQILSEHGIGAIQAEVAIRALRSKFEPRRLRPGQKVSLMVGQDGGRLNELHGLAIHLTEGGFVEVIGNKGGGFTVYRTTAFELAAMVERAGVATHKTAPRHSMGARREGPATPRGAHPTVVAQEASSGPSAAEPTLGEATPSLAAAEHTTTVTVVTAKGDTLLKVLTTAGISRREALSALRQLMPVFNPRRLKIGQAITIVRAADEDSARRLLAVDVTLRDGRHAQIARTSDTQFESKISSLALVPQDAGPDEASMVAQDGAPAPIIPDEPASPAVAASAPASVADDDAEQTSVPRPIAKPNRTQLADSAIPRPVRRPSLPPKPSSTVAATERTEPALPASPTPAVAAAREGAATPAPAPALPDAPTLRAQPNAKTVAVARGDTLMAILRRNGIDRVEADRAIRAARQVMNLRRLSIGQEITLVIGTDDTGANALDGIGIELGEERAVQISRTGPETFAAKRVAGLERAFTTPRRIVRKRLDVNGKRHRAAVTADAEQGAVMAGAIVAAAAPIAEDPPEGDATALALAAIKTARGHTDDSGLIRKAVVIGQGDTLASTLARAGSDDDDAHAAIEAFREVHNPRRLQIGQTLSLAFEPRGGGEPRLAEIALDVAPDRNVIVSRAENGAFESREIERPLIRSLRKTRGQIRNNLYDAAAQAGVPIDILTETLHIFSFDVDFQREIQSGDRFEVLYEITQSEGGAVVGNGPILYAALWVSGRKIELYRYEPENGPSDYLTSEGQSARKTLMRTPIQGGRLSSGYGMRRHPVLGYNKKHTGVDFAAPRGTPILAAGDGVIERIGRFGTYGKYVRIRHNGSYSTAYAHLSRYAKGMRNGKRVRQGQVIGYVGSTGRSTGPHLHYEVLKGGKQVNPMRLKLPTRQKLAGDELIAFQNQLIKIQVLLAETPTETQVASQ